MEMQFYIFTTLKMRTLFQKYVFVWNKNTIYFLEIEFLNIKY